MWNFGNGFKYCDFICFAEWKAHLKFWYSICIGQNIRRMIFTIPHNCLVFWYPDQSLNPSWPKLFLTFCPGDQSTDISSIYLFPPSFPVFLSYSTLASSNKLPVDQALPVCWGGDCPWKYCCKYNDGDTSLFTSKGSVHGFHCTLTAIKRCSNNRGN